MAYQDLNPPYVHTKPYQCRGVVVAEVDEYIEKYRYHSDSRALFTTRTGRYNYNKLRQIIKYIGVHSGVPDIHPHSFRHYYATTLVRLGVDIRRVQILVGHCSVLLSLF